jgi:hypothetical protein
LCIVAGAASRVEQIVLCGEGKAENRGVEEIEQQMGSVFATRMCVAAVTIRLNAGISIVNTAGTLDRRGAGLYRAAR